MLGFTALEQEMCRNPPMKLEQQPVEITRKYNGIKIIPGFVSYYIILDGSALGFP